MAVVLVSCRPRGVLSSRQMRRVMIDLHKTDAVLQVKGLQHGHDEAEDAYYAQVLAMHGITQEQFDSSLVWYTNHPQIFDKIYPKVLSQLEAERDAYVALHTEDLNAVHLPSDTPAPLTTEQLQRAVDSTLWVTMHGYPAHGWIPPFHPTPPQVPYIQ